MMGIDLHKCYKEYLVTYGIHKLFEIMLLFLLEVFKKWYFLHTIHADNVTEQKDYKVIISE